MLGGITGTAILINLLTAALGGLGIALLLHRLGIDPSTLGQHHRRADPLLLKTSLGRIACRGLHHGRHQHDHDERQRNAGHGP